MAEHHAPKQIVPKSLGDYLEVMSKVVFQAGISWKVVESKWTDIRQAFRGFDAAAVAAITPSGLDKLVEDTRVIRNRRKLEAIVGNARRMIELDRQHKGFQKFLRSQTNFAETVKDLRKQFKFLGDMGCYHFLYVVGEKVPPYEEWSAGRG